MEYNYNDEVIIEVDLEVGEKYTLYEIDSAIERASWKDERIVYNVGMDYEMALDHEFYCFRLENEICNDLQLNIEFEITGEKGEKIGETQVEITEIDFL